MGTIKDIYDVIKDLLKFAKESENQEMSELAIKLQCDFFSLKEENEKLKEENKQLKSKLSEEKDIKKIQKDLISQTSSFYIRESDTIERYYCGRCWDKDKKLIQCHTHPHWTERQYKQLTCPECDMYITIYKDYINMSK